MFNIMINNKRSEMNRNEAKRYSVNKYNELKIKHKEKTHSCLTVTLRFQFYQIKTLHLFKLSV